MASSAEARSPQAGASSEPAAGAPADQNGVAAAAATSISAEEPNAATAPAGVGSLLTAPKSPAPPRNEADLRAEFEALCSKQSAGRSVAWAHLEPVLLTDAANGTPKEVITVKLIAGLPGLTSCCDCSY